MKRKENQDLMERIKSPRLSHRELSHEERIEVFQRSWSSKATDWHFAPTDWSYMCEGAPLVLKFEDGSELEVDPDEICSLAKMHRFLQMRKWGTNTYPSVSINSEIRPSMWKAGCMAILEECRKARDIQTTELIKAISPIDYVAITQRFIKEIINDRYKASIVTDVFSNTYRNLFVMREPLVFDIKANRIIVKRSNMTSYIINSYFEQLEEVNINDGKIMAKAMHGLGFRRVNMSLIARPGRIQHNCALDVIDASMIIDNAGAVTDAAE